MTVVTATMLWMYMQFQIVQTYYSYIFIAAHLEACAENARLDNGHHTVRVSCFWRSLQNATNYVHKK